MAGDRIKLEDVIDPRIKKELDAIVKASSEVVAQFKAIYDIRRNESAEAYGLMEIALLNRILETMERIEKSINEKKEEVKVNVAKETIVEEVKKTPVTKK